MDDNNYSFIDVATSYHDMGYYCVACDENKKAAEVYSEFPSLEAVIAGFESEAANIAVVTGQVSSGLQAIDINCKHDLSGKLWEDFEAHVKKFLPQLYAKLVIHKTPAVGYHLFFTCEVTGRSRPLASRKSNNIERAASDKVLEKQLISLSSMYAYVLIPPSDNYELIQGSFYDIPKISPAEYELLLACCTHFDRMGAAINFKTIAGNKDHINQALYGDNDWAIYTLKPWEDYNQRGDVMGLLRELGWIATGESTQLDGRKVINICLINQQKVIRGTIGLIDKMMEVDSPGEIFPVERLMFPFEVFLLANSLGNASDAVKELIALDFGVVKGGKPKPQPPTMLVRPFYTIDDLRDQLPEEQYTTVKTFWRVSMNTRSNVKIDIDDKKYINWLNSWGLYLYPKSNDRKSPFVVVQNNVIEEVDMKFIKDITRDYIRSLPEEFDGINKNDLENVLLKSAFRIFDTRFLDFLPMFDKPLLRDTVSTGYIPFRNGVLQITVKGFTILSYAEVPFAVWKSHIIDHDFHPNSQSGVTCVFSNFVSRISGNDQLQFDAAVSVIGYLLHTYKDKSKPYLVNLTDHRDSLLPEGGTGKGVLIQAIEEIRKVVNLDGKKKDVASRNFAWQQVRADTNIIVIQDLHRGFDPEIIFNAITEGLTIEVKYGLEKYVNFQDSPKIVVTGNYRMEGDSGSHRRRKITFDLFPYFSHAYTPVMEYGKRFFQGWDYEHWNAFYNFMGLCLHAYIKRGIVIGPGYSQEKKDFRRFTCDLFVEWWVTVIHNPAEGDSFKTKEFLKSDLLKRYCEFSSSSITDTEFTSWVLRGCEFSSLEVKNKKIRGENAWEMRKGSIVKKHVSYSLSSTKNRLPAQILLHK